MTKIQVDESQNTEYKESWNDKYLQWICGFANAQGGKIYLGVDDDHVVVGIEDSKRLMEDIPNKIVTHLGIVCDVNLLTAEELDYIEIMVEPSSVPINYRGHYHYRSGSTKQELTGVALQEFVLKKMGRSWDEIVNPRITLDAIDRDAVDYFLKKGIRAGRIDEDEKNASTEEVLQNLNLVDDDSNLTNAAVLLFGKNPQRYFPGAQFRIGRFGKDEADLIIQDEVDGNIIQMADTVMKKLKSFYLTSPITYEGMQRIETLEIPEAALREIVYNAIVHKSYTGAHIQMHVYDDHVEVWNDGELPVGYTQEVLMQRHSSRPRNKNIAFAFMKAGFIESWGRGYKKIREEFEKAGLPIPTVESHCGGTLVTFKRPQNSENVGSDVGSDVGSFGGNMAVMQLTDRQKKILELIKLNPQVSATQMSVIMSVVKRTIERDLAALQSKMIIRREGNTSAGHWVVLIDNI